jgi:SAM-dependent methyltransferase
MATSRWEQLPFIIETLLHINPKTVLDVGVGFGKIGLLIREYLEDMQGRTNPKDWIIHIAGIEIYEPYHRNSFQNRIYDYIYYFNALDIDNYFFNSQSNTYDLLTCFDCVEHNKKDDAIVLLNKFKKYAKKILISIPIGDNWYYIYKGENIHENHLSDFTEKDLNDLGYKTLLIYDVPNNRKMGIFGINI